MFKFDELFNQGLLVFTLGHDTDAVEVQGYELVPHPFDGRDRVVILYEADDPSETRRYDTGMELYDLIEEVVYFGTSGLTNHHL